MKFFYFLSCVPCRRSRWVCKIFQTLCMFCPFLLFVPYYYYFILVPSLKSIPETPDLCLELHSKGQNLTFVSTPLQKSKYTELQSFASLMGSFPWCEYNMAVEQINLTQINAFSEHLLTTILVPFVVAEPLVPVKESCETPPLIGVGNGTEGWNCELLTTPRKVGVLVNFGFDVDALEVHLHELDSIVDYFFLMEGSKPLNRILSTKQSIWDMVKHTSRFSRFRHKIVHFIVDDAAYSRIDRMNRRPKRWDRENMQTQLRLQKFLDWNNNTGFFGPEDLIGIGDTDEIPNRDAINILKHCKYYDEGGAENIGIWFPYPYDDTIFASDFPVAPKRHDFTLGNPAYWTVTAAEKLVNETAPGRGPRKEKLSYLLGGMHFSAYPYLPFQMIKFLTATEEGTDFQGIKKTIDIGMIYLDNATQKKKGNDSDDDERINAVAHRRVVENYILHPGVRDRVISLDEFRLRYGKQEADAIVKVPWFYKCNRNRYPSFRRELDLRLDGVYQSD